MKDFKSLLFGALLGVVAVAAVGAVATFTVYPHVAMTDQTGAITNCTLASGGLPASAAYFNQWNRLTNVVLDVTSLTNGGSGGFASKVAQENASHTLTNVTLLFTSLTNGGSGGFPAKPVLQNGTGLATNTTLNVASVNGLLFGQCVSAADGTVTQTFATAFSAAPYIMFQRVSATGVAGTNSVVEKTAAYFVLQTGEVGATNNWIAVGAP